LLLVAFHIAKYTQIAKFVKQSFPLYISGVLPLRSSFYAEKLDNKCRPGDNLGMETTGHILRTRNAARTVRQQIEAGGERVWRMSDFAGLPFPAVAQTLSRMTRQGQLRRLGKGLYYRQRQTAFGPSLPNPAVIRSLPVRQRAFPAGLAAANLLGFTTQNPARIELATEGMSLPRLIVGADAVVHTRRPPAWRSLSDTEAALLDFLRNRGETSELSPQETVQRLLAHLREPGRYERVLQAAATEPPRVRAILGAVGQELQQPPGVLNWLRASLNPLSRFEFGILSALPPAQEWQAKERRPRATV
jgi:hypothetical protein